MNPLAVMVDLGWPWWVTSVIASSVVVVTCTIALLARRPVVRAVAVVLAIEGVVIAVIAPFAMQENASGRSAMDASPSAMDASPSAMDESPSAMDESPSAMGAATLTRAEFARRADANCAAWGRFAGTLGDWPPATALPATARFLGRLVPFDGDIVRDQGELRPPEAEQAIAAAWMNSMTASHHALETILYSAKVGSRAGVRAGYRALDAADAKSTATSKQLGLKVCFS